MDDLKVEGKQSTIRASKLIFIVCALVYACAYIARGNYSVVVDLMKRESVIGDSTAGLISATYFICYTVGQFVNGIIADRKSPLSMVIIGVSIIIASQIAMILLSSIEWLMVVSWGINGIGQSMLWSPIFFILNNALNKSLRFKAITLISLTTPIGKIASYFMSGLSLDIAQQKWQSVFYMAAIIMVIVLTMWIVVNVSQKKEIVFEENAKKKDEKKGGIGSLFVSTGLFLLVPAMIVHGLFLNGATEWVPTIIQNRYNVSSSMSGYLMMAVPTIGVLGVFFCNLIYKNLFKCDEGNTGIFLMSLTLFLVGMLYLINISSGANTTLMCVLFVLVYGLIYTVQLGFNHLSITLIPMHFVSLGLASSFSGTLNAINYGGSAISTYAISFITGNTNTLFIIWVVSLVIAIVSITLFRPRWKKFSKETPISE